MKAKRFVLSLRLRVTLLTMLTLLVSTAALTLLINRGVTKRLTVAATPIAAVAVELIESTPSNFAEVVPFTAVESTKAVELVKTELAVASVSIRDYSYLILALIILGGGVCTYFAVGGSLSPVKQLSDEIAAVSPSMDTRLDELGTTPELRPLAQSFNAMLDNLSGAFEAQKRFSASAAHELRTPIAILQSNLEVLDEDASMEDYARFAEVCGRTCSRMEALVTRLLELTNLRVTLSESVDLDELARSVCAECDFEVECDTGGAGIIGGDAHLLRSALQNLIENAAKHNDAGVHIRVTTGRGERPYIAVEDDGKGIPPEDAAMIFEPFYRVEQSRSRALGGAGLGLYLVDEIARLHGGKLTLDCRSGCVFTLIF